MAGRVLSYKLEDGKTIARLAIDEGRFCEIAFEGVALFEMGQAVVFFGERKNGVFTATKFEVLRKEKR
jgi:hypothetical protein